MVLEGETGLGQFWMSDAIFQPAKVASSLGPVGRNIEDEVKAMEQEWQEERLQAIRKLWGASTSADEKVPVLEQRIRQLEQENRSLRNALGSLREIGAGVLKSLGVPLSNEATVQLPGKAQDRIVENAASRSLASPSLQPGGEQQRVAPPGLIAASGGPEVITFTFTLRKADNTDLGLDVSSGKADDGLLVEKILPGGAAEAWNRHQDPATGAGRDLRRGDRIIKVNETEGDIAAMLEECRLKKLLKFTVQRAGSETQGTKLPDPPLGQLPCSATSPLEDGRWPLTPRDRVTKISSAFEPAPGDASVSTCTPANSVWPSPSWQPQPVAERFPGTYCSTRPVTMI
eukprot:TRINITY_DN76074_c0_g1_i1.p1 TRINITY_DN76074_c0_g1~~TRINITY_DN76074_c0_g1_i1.p1  ORF type:complete len:367 (+),score=77.84 TRINITY_DN76074_c0_g1_i1:72-1103(+)